MVAALGLGWAVLGGAQPAHAIEPYLVSVGLLGGIGGPLDANAPDPGFANRSLQAQIGLLTAPSTLVQLRLGRIDFGNGDRLGDLSAPTLSYATVAGEYRFPRGYYDSGMFLGLGAYRLEGDRADGSHSQTSIGATLGVTGEVEINKWMGILAEVAGHYTQLDEANFFGTAQVGLAVHF